MPVLLQPRGSGHYCRTDAAKKRVFHGWRRLPHRMTGSSFGNPARDCSQKRPEVKPITVSDHRSGKTQNEMVIRAEASPYRHE